MIEDIYLLKNRNAPQKYTKYKATEKSNVAETDKKIDYLFYICDFCGAEIKIINKPHEMSGGINILPNTLTKVGEIKIALCNKCVKPLLKLLEDKNG